jgi:hypothetical protein
LTTRKLIVRRLGTAAQHCLPNRGNSSCL